MGATVVPEKGYLQRPPKGVPYQEAILLIQQCNNGVDALGIRPLPDVSILGNLVQEQIGLHQLEFQHLW